MKVSLIQAALLAAPLCAVLPALRVQAAQTTPSTASVPADWKVYRNPIGLTFHYPSSWSMTDINGQLVLVPPGAQVPAGGTLSEIYAVMGMPVPGISRVDDPRLLPVLTRLACRNFFRNQNQPSSSMKRQPIAPSSTSPRAGPIPRWATASPWVIASSSTDAWWRTSA